MKISFDGLRKNIALDLNNLIESVNESPNVSYLAENEIKPYLGSLRRSIGALLACYDRDQMPDDFNDLSDEIKLLEL